MRKATAAKSSKASQGGDASENKSEYAEDAGLYYIALEFTLASLGIWPYESARPRTDFERWLAAVIIFFAAIIYAWLAGVIVELVSRSTEDTRDIDGNFDMLVSYLDCVGFPHERRQHVEPEQVP